MRRLAAAALIALCACAPSAAETAGPRQTSGRAALDKPFRFAVLGDFGTGDANQQAVADSMCAWRAEKPFRLVVTTGDNIYPDGGRDRFDAAFFRPYDCLLSDGVRFRASLGNHDIVTGNGRPELDEPAFGMKGRNYVVRVGGVRFVIADSNDLKRDWLRQALRTRAGDRWTVVAFHHPVYSPGTHGSEPGLRERVASMFARKGVDLVVNGHDHLYAVTKPRRGIRYVVTGGGGAGLYECSEASFSARCEERFHFVYVIAGDDSLWVRAIAPDGNVFHTFRTDGLN